MSDEPTVRCRLFHRYSRWRREGRYQYRVCQRCGFTDAWPI